VSKKYTASEVKSILREVCDRNYKMIASAQEELNKMKLTPEEMEITGSENIRVNTARYLMSLITVLSDIVSPAFNVSLQLCAKENQEFISHIAERHAAFVNSERKRKELLSKKEEEKDVSAVNS
jgi:hypothetical protein